MRHVRLISHTDEHGNTGLIIKGTAIFENLSASISGGLLAHDLIEHQNGVDKIGCPADELQALGSLWHVRGQYGEFLSRYANIYTPEENMAHNVYHVATELDGCGWWPGTVNYRTRPHYQDEAFRQIIALAGDMIQRNIEADNGEFGEDFPVDAFLADALHLLRTGYRKSERRWGDGMNAHDQFRAVRDAVDLVLPEVQVGGQEFILSYGRGRAACREDVSRWLM